MFRNFVWDFLGKISGQLSAFIVSIVLTRLLKPEEYGIMGMAMVIIAFSAIFLNLGFSNAIIQQKEISKQQLSTVFYLNLGVGIILFLLCFLAAGSIADFYNQPQVKPVFRALSFTFIISALNIVPTSLLYRQMKFKVSTIIGVISTIISGITGIIMAYKGYGVWSLVAQSMTASFLSLIFITLYIRFLPLRYFNFSSVKPLWKYGSKLFASGILDTLFTRLDVFIIGKIFNPATLGLYTRAQTLDVFVRQLSSGSIASVLFPFIAKHQDDRQFVREQYIRALHVIMMVSVGIGGLLYVVAEDLFVFLFSSRWLVSGSYFRIMALAVFVWPVSNLMCTLISALGNSHAFLKLEALKKAAYIPVYAMGFLWGIEGFIYCLVASFYFALFLNILFVKKEIGVTIRRQLQIIIPYVIAGLIATVMGYLLAENVIAGYGIIVRLIAGVFVYFVSYIGLIIFSKSPAWVITKGIITKRTRSLI